MEKIRRWIQKRIANRIFVTNFQKPIANLGIMVYNQYVEINKRRF